MTKRISAVIEAPISRRFPAHHSGDQKAGARNCRDDGSYEIDKIGSRIPGSIPLAAMARSGLDPRSECDVPSTTTERGAVYLCVLIRYDGQTASTASGARYYGWRS